MRTSVSGSNLLDRLKRALVWIMRTRTSEKYCLLGHDEIIVFHIYLFKLLILNRYDFVLYGWDFMTSEAFKYSQRGFIFCDSFFFYSFWNLFNQGFSYQVKIKFQSDLFEAVFFFFFLQFKGYFRFTKRRGMKRQDCNGLQFYD